MDSGNILAWSVKRRSIMKRRWFLPVSLGLASVLVMVGLGGCTPGGAAISIPSPQQQEGILVSGRGEVTVTPDIAILSLGIVAQESSVSEAQNQAFEAMNKVMAALTDNGIEEKDIQTHRFNIRQRTRWSDDDGEEVVVGYRVTNMVIAKIRDVDYESRPLDYRVGIIIDAVAEAGGDLTRIDNVTFSVDDPSVYYGEAREKAMTDAKAKAEHLADLAEVALGKPIYISEGAQFSPIWEELRYMGGGGMAPVPTAAPPSSISPGEMKVSLIVQVTYSIK